MKGLIITTRTRMGETGNFDQFCHERITHTICG